MNGLVIRLGIYERHVLVLFLSLFLLLLFYLFYLFLRFMPLPIVRSMGEASEEGGLMSYLSVPDLDALENEIVTPLLPPIMT